MRWAACFVVMLFASTLAAQPSLRFADPAGVVPGEKMQVTLFGNNLTDVTQLWTAFEGKAQLAEQVQNNGQLKNRVVYDIQVPADARVGIYGVRLGTKAGCSDFCPLMIDDLPAIKEDSKNKAAETAQPISFPTAVDGVYEAESYDFYQFTAKAGQKITFEVVAQRMGSPFDSMLRVLDASGQRELAFSDDAPGIGTDSRLQFEPTSDGTYLLEVRDVRFQGGGNHRYRLRAGDFPPASICLPMAVQRGVETKVQLWGTQADQQTTTTVRLDANTAAGQVWLNATGPSGKGSAFLPLLVSDMPEVLEQEPNNHRDQATPISLPAGLNGRLHEPGETDYFRFEAKKGQRIRFDGMGRSLGSPVDLILRVLDANGRQLAQVDDSGTEEGNLNFNPPADGTYFLAVEDLTENGGPEYGYRVAAHFTQPSFSLSLQDPANKNAPLEKLTVPQGGVAQITVNAARRGYNEEIELSLEGLPNTVRVSKNTIAAGKPNTSLQLEFPKDLPAGSLFAVQVIGTAKIGKQTVRVPADISDGLISEFANYPYIPEQLSHHFGVGIGPEFPSFFDLTLEPAYLALPSGLASTEKVKVTTKRGNGFQDPIQLALSGLPEGVKAKTPEIAKNKNDTTLELTIPANLPNGKYPLELTGSATFQLQPQQVKQPLTLHITRPLAFAVQPLGNLPQKGKQKLRLVVNRLSVVDQPITFQINHLPNGVKVEGSTTLPPNQQVLELELASDGKVAKGKFRFSITASTKIKNQAYQLESLPIELQIQ